MYGTWQIFKRCERALHVSTPCKIHVIITLFDELKTLLPSGPDEQRGICWSKYCTLSLPNSISVLQAIAGLLAFLSLSERTGVYQRITEK